MNKEQKDAICQLWVEIFGTQEGVGYNCPQGAYDFAEVVMAYEREQNAILCEKLGAEEYGSLYIAAAIRARNEK